MPVSYENQFVFFHIPRCAGTSIDYYYNFHDGNPLFGSKIIGENVLTLQHLTYKDILQDGFISKESLQSFFKFTIIRDPFERMISDFYWQKKHDIHGIFLDLSFSKYLDFAEIIIEEKLYFEKQHYDHFRPMTDFCFYKEKVVVDEILTLEKLEEGINRISARINMTSLMHLNRSNRDPSTEFSSQHRDRVYSLYAADKELHESVFSGRKIEAVNA